MVNFNDRAERARYLEQLELDATAEAGDRMARAAAKAAPVCTADGWPLPEPPPSPSSRPARSTAAASDALLQRRIEAAVEKVFREKCADIFESVGMALSEERRRHKNEIRRLRGSLKTLRAELHAMQSAQKMKLVA